MEHGDLGVNNSSVSRLNKTVEARKKGLNLLKQRVACMPEDRGDVMVVDTVQ